MKADEYIAGSEARVWDETFVIAKARKIDPRAFCNINDDGEITLIIEQEKLDEDTVIKFDKDWKLITIQVQLAFDVVGVVAKLSTRLAEAGISIFIVTGYTRDHILVKKENLDRAIEALEEFDIKIARSQDQG